MQFINTLILASLVVSAPIKQQSPLNGVCGGIMGIHCQKGLKCVLPVQSDPKIVINDAQGICKRDTIHNPAKLNQVCGGLIGIECESGLECQFPTNPDPTIVINDAQGVCKRMTTVHSPVSLNGVCGGLMGLECASGLECQFPVNPDPTIVINDAQGICKSVSTANIHKPAKLNQVCGGLIGIECESGLECQFPVNPDPTIVINDAQGVCKRKHQRRCSIH